MTGTTMTLADLGWTQFFTAQLTPAEVAQTIPARVSGVHRNGVAIITADGIVPGTMPLPPRLHQCAEEERPTVGDWLLLDATTERPERRLDRKSLFLRKAAGAEARLQPIAANVDTTLITASCNQDFNLSRIERYLALAQEAETYPVVVLTKADLTDEAAGRRTEAESLMPGLLVECINATDAESVAPIWQWCGRGQTIVVVGSSGAGKSTLVNTLNGHEIQATRGIRVDDDKGRHTTTARSLHALPGGGWVIDTPGMRELQLPELSSGLGDVFAEIDALAAQCRFSDCSHTDEPGCAVTAAVVAGTLEPRRLQSYSKLLAEEAANSQTLAERRQRDRAFGRKMRAIQAHAQRIKRGPPG